MTREDLIKEFQNWLDTNPNPSIIAVECANIAEKFAKTICDHPIDRLKSTGQFRPVLKCSKCNQDV